MDGDGAAPGLGNFWPLQGAETETGVYLGLALALALTGFCVWWVRRRLT